MFSECITFKKLRSGNYEEVEHGSLSFDEEGISFCSEKDIKDWWNNKPTYTKVIRKRYSKSWVLYSDADDLIKWYNKGVTNV